MHFRNGLLAMIIASFMLVAPVAFAEHHEGTEAGEPMSPDAFVWFSRKGIGAFIGGSAGGGRIKYKGDDHTFRMTGISVGIVGGIGETRMSGEVYGLTKLEDFEGTYKQSSAGISAIVGASGVWIENEKGVKMNLKAENTGIGINIGIGTVEVKLGMVDE